MLIPCLESWFSRILASRKASTPEEKGQYPDGAWNLLSVANYKPNLEKQAVLQTSIVLDVVDLVEDVLNVPHAQRERFVRELRME